MRPIVNHGKSVADLINNLDSQLEIHLVLLQVLEEENRLSASCGLNHLKEIHVTRDFAAKRIFELEKNRLVIMESYKGKSETKTDISFKDIIVHCKEEEQKELTELRQRLLNVINEIRSIGKSNAETAIARISCFNEVQGALDKSLNRLSTYSGKGIITKPTGSSFLRKSV